MNGRPALRGPATLCAGMAIYVDEEGPADVVSVRRDRLPATRPGEVRGFTYDVRVRVRATGHTITLCNVRPTDRYRMVPDA